MCRFASIKLSINPNVLGPMQDICVCIYNTGILLLLHIFLPDAYPPPHYPQQSYTIQQVEDPNNSGLKAPQPYPPQLDDNPAIEPYPTQQYQPTPPAYDGQKDDAQPVQVCKLHDAYVYIYIPSKNSIAEKKCASSTAELTSNGKK